MKFLTTLIMAIIFSSQGLFAAEVKSITFQVITSKNKELSYSYLAPTGISTDDKEALYDLAKESIRICFTENEESFLQNAKALKITVQSNNDDADSDLYKKEILDHKEQIRSMMSFARGLINTISGFAGALEKGNTAKSSLAIGLVFGSSSAFFQYNNQLVGDFLNESVWSDYFIPKGKYPLWHTLAHKTEGLANSLTLDAIYTTLGNAGISLFSTAAKASTTALGFAKMTLKGSVAGFLPTAFWELAINGQKKKEQALAQTQEEFEWAQMKADGKVAGASMVIVAGQIGVLLEMAAAPYVVGGMTVAGGAYYLYDLYSE